MTLTKFVGPANYSAMTNLTDAARVLGKQGGHAGKGRPKRISPEERVRRAERMRRLRVSARRQSNQ